jgi:O-antigen/teichoic acid export membrane protein
VFFVTQVITAGLVLFNGFLVAHLIGPEGRGDYYLLSFFATTLMVLGQLGLPAAFTFFSARGRLQGSLSRAFGLTVVISVPMLIATLALLPVLRATVLHGLETTLVVLPLLAVPFLLHANFTTGIVVGRQAAIGMAIVYITTYLVTTALIVVLVGFLGLGVWGALITFVVAAIVTAVGFFFCAIAVLRRAHDTGPASYAELFRYGLPYFPGTLSRFFAARVDIYLLALLIPDPSAPLGYYSMAVALAEIVYLFPTSVSTFFFPHVAGASRADSDRQVGTVSRVTLLTTGAVAIALIPFGFLAIRFLLPAFEPALVPLYIILPGVVALAVTNVLVGYISGLGRPGIASAVSLVALLANGLFNLLLIPTFGIVGAAAASLCSYVLSSIAFSVLTARLIGQPLRDFWIPRRSDLAFVMSMSIGLLRRLLPWTRPAERPRSTD